MKKKEKCNSFSEINNLNDAKGVIAYQYNTAVSRPKVLLHSCCGPCSTAVIERLYLDYDITVFYYNPCITDWDEYEKRKENQIRFIELFNEKIKKDFLEFQKHDVIVNTINFIEGDYDVNRYLELVRGLEDEPEGGKRCEVCFRQRLDVAAKTAKQEGLDYFTTTLTVSPHKNYELISGIGRELQNLYNIKFLDIDFKKQAGFQRSIELSKEYELYRQNYCGCEFSKR